jgi:cobalt-zinc-cadmium efflux system protein
MSGHAHGTANSAGGRHRRSLAIVFTLVVAYALVELIVGWWAGSLALVADAGHMATDAIGVGLALAAISAALHGTRDPARTFGHYRWEVVAALANAALLLGVCAYVLVEGIQRLREPVPMAAVPVLLAALGGLTINLISFRLLHAGAKESLNVRGAYVEVLADMIGSIGVVVAALVVLATGWLYADPIVALGLAVVIVPRAVRLGREALRILTQAAPADVDLAGVKEGLLQVPGVCEVHDLHVWTLTSGMHVASVHLVAESTATLPDAATLALTRAREVFARIGLDHATIQVEDRTTSESCSSQW